MIYKVRDQVTECKYMNADVVFDGGGGAPANHLYFLNSDFIFYRPHANRNMVPLENKTAVNQDATVVPLIWAGNMTMSNGALQASLND